MKVSAPRPALRFGQAQPPDFWVAVHRGLHGSDYPAPENSMAAFEQTAKEGLGIELDVRLTQDNQVVVHHDARPGRIFSMPDQTGPDQTGWGPLVHELTYQQLKSARPQFQKPPKPGLGRRLEDFILRVKHHTPAQEFNRQHPPLLKDVIQRIQPHGVPLLVELKILSQKEAPNLSEGQIQALNQKLGAETAKVLHNSGYEDRSMLIGFDGNMLKAAKAADAQLHPDQRPQVQTGLIPFTELLPARMPFGKIKPHHGDAPPVNSSDTMVQSLAEGLLCRVLPYNPQKLRQTLSNWKNAYQLDAILPSYGEVNPAFMQTARALNLKVLPGRCWERPSKEVKEAQRMQRLGADGVVVTHRARELHQRLKP